MTSLISRGVLPVLAVAVVFFAAKEWLEWKDENNTRTMDRILSAEQMRAIPAPEEALQPILVQLETDQSALVNPTRFPIYYNGYTIHGFDKRPPRGEIRPFYRAKYQDENGQWRLIGLGWCGTGSGRMSVPPGHAGRFRASNKGNGQSARIGVNYWRADPHVMETVWSEPIRQ